MKHTITLLFLLVTFAGSAQTNMIKERREFQSPFDNSFAVLLQTSSWGLGARYEYRFGLLGGYVYGSLGDYPINPSFINDEMTVGAGLVLAPAQRYTTYYPAFTLGVNYSEYTFYESDMPIPETRADDMFSLDLGLSAQHGRVNFGFNADVIKWRIAVFVGVNF